MTKSLLVGFVAIVAVMPVAAEPAGDLYRNESKGFSFSKPTGWEFVDPSVLVEHLGMIGWAGDELGAVVTTKGRQSLVAATHEPLIDDPFSPSILVQVASLEERAGASPLRVLEGLVEDKRLANSRFEVAVEPHEAGVNGLDVATCTLDRSGASPGGLPMHLRVTHVVLVHKKQIYYFSFVDLLGEGLDLGREVQEVVDSVRFVSTGA